MNTHKFTSAPRLKLLAICVAVAATSLPLSSHAAVIEIVAEGSYSMNGGSTTNLQQGGVGTPLTSVDVLHFSSDGSSQVGLHSYGSTFGDFGSRSSGAGVYDVTGLFRIRETVTNNTGAATNVRFNFNITPGILSNDIRSAFGSGEFVESSILFNIDKRINGGAVQDVWTSQATLRSDSGGIGQFSASGDNVSFYTASNFGCQAPFGSFGCGVYYDVQNHSQTLDLGLLDAGATLEIIYELSTTARGNSAGTGGITVPEQTVTVPGHWEWTQNQFATYGGGAFTADCSGYGELARQPAVVADIGGQPGYGGNISADPNTPPTPSPCWFYVAEHTQVIPGYTINDGVNGSQGSSGDPFTLSLGPNPGPGSTFVGNLPLQGGLNVPEPGSVPLLLAAMAGFWLHRRRRS